MTRRTIASLSQLMLVLLACHACDLKATGTKTAASAPTSQHNEAPVERALLEEQRRAQGKALYVRYCKLCHGEDGAGYAADNAGQLGNPLFVASATWDLIWFGITYGRPGTAMAAFGKSQGGPLDDDQVKNLVKYIQSLRYYRRDTPAPAGDGGRGSELYGTRCAACHGPRGEGKTGPSLSNPYFLISASDSFLTYAIKYGRPAT